MPKVTQIKIGQVLVKEIAPRKWRASWTDPASKRHIRRILPGANFKEAEAQAKEINATLAQGKGFGGRLRGTAGGHAIADAVLEAVKHSDANDRTRKDYLSRFNSFASYLAENLPGVTEWGELNEEIIQNFIEHSKREGIKHDTLRLRLAVLRLTSTYMERTHHYRHIFRGVRLKRTKPTLAEQSKADSILSPDVLRALVAWLEVNRPMVHVWGVLAGYSGMRMLECAYLREQDFCAADRTVTITENEAHTPKNAPSYRTIPIPAVAARALSRWISGLVVRDVHGFIFQPQREMTGRLNAKTREARAGALVRDRVSHIWKEALQAARADGLDLPAGFTPRLLRSSFVTMLRETGADFPTLQAYIGHAPSTVLAAHYDRVSMDRLRTVSALADRLSEAAPAEIKNGGLLH